MKKILNNHRSLAMMIKAENQKYLFIPVSSSSLLTAKSLKRKRRFDRIKEKLTYLFFLGHAALAIFIILGMFIFLLLNTLQAFKVVSIKEFFTSTMWDPTSPEKARYGLLSLFVSSAMVTIGALVLAVPIGLGVAAYLSDVASWRVREIVKPIIEILAGLPSVVVGFLGVVFFGPIISRIFNISSGLTALNGSLLLAVMALPTIISISEDSLKAVPVSYSEASLALGASRWQTLIRVKFPAALSGIIASIMLGFGRAIGETMTVLMATGNARSFPHGYLDSIRTLTATIAIELGEVPYHTTHYYALFAIGFILFLITFGVNLIADILLNKYQQRKQ